MMETNFWLIRHALVDENARAFLYGVMDVPLCETTLLEQAPMYQALARRLPRPAVWVVTPLSRTRRTAETLFRHGYPEQSLAVEPDLIEQSLGEWQGLPHAELPPKLLLPKHAFWPLAGNEKPPGGETMIEVIDRVGRAMERLAVDHAGRDVVVISHGGAIRAAVAHALKIEPDTALHMSIHNLGLTRLDHTPEGWRVACVNELPGY
ncbi:MAG: histidine phosphatase family protein [Proteobacteria bacterium]|nr:histidine phosphatase family protein [Pseudomonadota bacterium]